MSKIATYSLADSPLQLSDRLIGTEAPRTPPSITPLATKNFSLGELLQLFSSNFPAANLQAVLNAGNTATQDINLTGTITTTLIKPMNIEDMLGSEGTPFQFLSKAIGGFNWVDLPSIGGGVQSVTGPTVDNTDPLNPIVGVANIQQVLDTPTRKWLTVDGDYTYSFDVFENGFFETYLSNNVTLDEYFFGLNTNGFYSNASDSTGQALFWNNAGSGIQAVFANSFGQNIFIGNLPREEAGNASIINPRNLPTGNYYSTISVNGNFANADGEIDLSTVYYPLSSNPANYISQDPILEFADFASFPVTGTVSTIYVALDTGFVYTWYSGSYHLSSNPNIGISGFGTLNTIPMFTPNGVTIKDSPLKYDPTIFGGGAVVSSKNVQIKGAVQFPLIMDRTGFSSMGFSLGNPGISQSSVFTILNSYRGDILSQTKLYLGLCDGSGTLTYGALSVEALGKLNITQTPDTGTTSDFVLLRDTSGNVKQIAYPTGGGTVTSVDLTMPVAFAVSGNPITTSGTLAVTAVGSASQYIRGDGQLATLPSNASGGSAVAYYLNGGTAASVATYYQMSKTAVIGTGVDFSLAGNGLISQWLTDVADPNRLEIPAGNWNFEMYMSASSSGGTPAFYVELLKYNGATFTTIANSSAVPEAITSGTIIDLYLTSLAIPQTTLLATDRLAVRVYIVNSTGGRTITMHTQDSHLCEIITNFAGGISALNGLTTNTQYLAVGTSGTDFAISSVTDTHTLNLPTASATNRGALSSADWSTFNSKAPLASPTFTGTVVLPSTTSIGTVSDTEIGYLDNVTSSIQTQFNNLHYKNILKDNSFWWSPNSVSNNAGASGFQYSPYLNNNTVIIQGNSNSINPLGYIRFSTTAVAGTLAFMRRNDFFILTGFSCTITRKIRFETNISGQRFFCGFSKNNQFAAPTNVDQTLLTDIVGVAQLSTSTNMHVIHNDNLGVGTTIDLGSSYPCNDTQYNYFITVEQTTTTYIVTVERVTVSTGASISTTNTLSSNIPVYNTGTIQLLTWISNNATLAIASYLDGGGYGTFKN
jgi:hypothetical protein